MPFYFVLRLLLLFYDSNIDFIFFFMLEFGRHILGIDVDPISLETAGENVTDLEVQYPVLQAHAIQRGS
jgi:hypothetical protein